MLETDTNLALQIPEEDIIDVELKEIQKKKFRLDRDNNRIIELNTSDLTIMSRLDEVYPRLMDFVGEAQAEINGTEDDEQKNTKVYEQLLVIDKKMRELINFVFDSDVSDKAAPEGTMYDLFNGKFRFEYVIERLLDLYDTNFTNEYALLKKNVSKHTSKYTKKKRK